VSLREQNTARLHRNGFAAARPGVALRRPRNSNGSEAGGLGVALRRPGSRNGAQTPRARLVEAMLGAVAEEGYASVSVTSLIARARVSSKTFYESFDGCEDCFLATFDECLRELKAVVGDAYQRPGSWARRVRAALEALLVFLSEDPATATLVFLEAPKAGAGVHERRQRVVEIVRVIVDAGRSESELGVLPPALMNEIMVEGAIGAIQARLSQREHAPLTSLLNSLMSVLVHSYLGPDAAAKELEYPLPDPVRTGRSRLGSTPSGVLAAVPMRLTYRTLRVLSAIAANPGASNRVVADAAGITDQAQISRLLSRLSGFALIRNDGLGAGKPNGWHLTLRGQQIEQAARHEIRQPNSGSRHGAAAAFRSSRV
jgi:AcrR family transcriptional regulator